MVGLCAHQSAMKGAERAAALTQRLLAFARLQPLAPQAVDIARLVTGMSDLLNRALGYDNPYWYHCRLVVDHNGRRLAKRHDSLSLRALRQRGLTPMNILSAELPVEA